MRIDAASTIMFIVFQCAVMVAFTFVYTTIGFERNFDVVSKTASFTPLTALYFSATTSSSVGYGDVVPRTDLARFLVIIQIIISWMPLMIQTL